MSDPKSNYMREIYMGGLQGQLPQTTSYEVLESLAKSKIPLEAYNYVAGSASTGSTCQSNLDAFKRWQIVPNMLNGVTLTEFDSRVTILGKEYPSPLVIAPIGVQAQLHPEADLATSRAACEIGVPFTLSSATSTPLETVAEQGGFEEGEQGSDKWFQLYWPQDDELTESLLKRAKKAGYRVLVVTLDTWTLGWRPRDLDRAYNPFLKGEGVANIFTDPVFVEKYCDGKSPLRKEATPDEILSASATAISQLSPGISRTWTELNLLRRLWGEDSPIVLKGIQSTSDAVKALEFGVEGIWISNHGGRQVDGAVPSLVQLSNLSSLIRSHPLKPGKKVRPSILFDSGVRSGSDVFKALCLGADAVAIGRPYAWGLANNGQAGVLDVLKTILADFEINASLAGCSGLKDLGPHLLIRNDAARL
ncbi:FMN-dependent alpha-hydroxy acid dehydrogenase [Violaceomyces palustris]|uniref:FMN-dependent alpha-hydroxy acid dehydrogenase n=1 Tax=Violaceomyces palustris TaxID=1673888 RepID=A0ACD0NQS2_9BASI|nr:FMN-dependent alpha-hydroxy acid dehydrogenase [Violaceomyces palustris]